MDDWRFLAWTMNGDGTETLLHPSLPLAGVTLEPILSGTASLSATIPVEVPLFETGGVGLVPHSTMIAAEYEGAIRGCFIITEIKDQGPQRSISAQGFVGYPTGIPFASDSSFSNKDALDVTRELWANVQSQPGGNIGLLLDSVKADVMVGQIPPGLWPKLAEGAKLAQPYPEHTEFVYTYTVRAAKPAVTKTTVVAGKKTTTVVTPAAAAVLETLNCEAVTSYPSPVPAGSTVIVRDPKTALVTRDLARPGVPAGHQVIGVGVPAPATDSSSQASTDQQQTAQETAAEIADAAYHLNWYSTADCKSAFDDLATQGKFDYWEEHSWDSNRLAIIHRLRFAPGAAGRVREDLRFVVGENVTEYPELAQPDGSFASEVIVLGAGQGSAMIRGTWKLTDNPRLRRVKTVTDSTITSTAAANARAEREGLIANGALSITQIVIMDHPNAPLGSWNLGDTITVQPRAAWSADHGPVKVRILSYQLGTDAGTCTLTVANAERATP